MVGGEGHLALDFATRVGRLRRPTLRYASQPLRGTNPAPSFASSFVIRHSSFPPAVVAKKHHPQTPSPRDAAASRYQPGFVGRYLLGEGEVNYDFCCVRATWESGNAVSFRTGESGFGIAEFLSGGT